MFHAEVDDPRPPYVIAMPPPNVTGSLHVGHALVTCVQDAIIRRARMTGHNAVWIPGQDHAGIATQIVVEKQLATEGLTRHDLGRDAFLARVWQWREEYGGVILRQLRRLGASADWEREAFTFDEPRSRAVREVFVALYEQGLIYRGTRLISWCPRCRTALSDIEVEHTEVTGELAYLRYPTVDGGDGVVVATTRVETMLGDTAVAVHPADERYRELIGATLLLPLMDREIPVVADDSVDPEFGTGAVKVTPAHDPNDYAIAERHGLPMIDVMTDDATMNDAAGRFAGLDRLAARDQVKAALDELGLLVKTEPHTYSVGVCSRCETVVEPRLSEQWFVAVRTLSEEAAAVVESGATRFVPARFTGPFLRWLRELHDWCISRQLWWGHRIPVWYCPDGHMTAAREDPTVCSTCGSGELRQDEDVLDTWFSSQLWPFTILGWPEQTPELAAWYPTSVLVTGYDINTFWVSRMLMMGVHILGDVPFRVVHNHGLVRDQYGKKMSKSFGNVIDPLDFIEAYGADALRFALFQHCAPGLDVPLAAEWVEGGKRFANKLWNVARLVGMNLGDTRPGPLPDVADLALEDRWILSRLEACRAEVDAAMDEFDWARAARALYAFAWDELADWYVEAAKVRLPRPGADDPPGADAARQVLATVLDDLLRLLHPLIPFVTETLWRALTGAGGGRDSLAVASWPVSRGPVDAEVEAQFALLQDVVTELRRFRSEHRVDPKRRIDVTLVTRYRDQLEPLAPLVALLAGLGSLVFADEAPSGDGASKVVFAGGEGEAFVPLAGLVDVDEELARLRKELERAEGEVTRLDGKLADDGFVSRAPAAVVERERAKRAEWSTVATTLREQLEGLTAAPRG